MVRSLYVSAVLFIAGAAVVPAVAQRGARLAGTVVAAADGRPLSGVTVALTGTPQVTVTDARGVFTLDGVPAGTQHIRLAYGAQVAGEHVTTLRPGATRSLSVVLDLDATDQAPTVVRTESAARRWGMAGFYARRAYGFATFFTRSEIARHDATTLGSFLAVTGVAIEGCAYGDCGAIMTIGGSRCRAQVLVNGLPTYGDMDRIDPEDVAGIEVYRADALVPLHLQASIYGTVTPMGFFGYVTGSCGAIVVWSRDWRPRTEW